MKCILRPHRKTLEEEDAPVVLISNADHADVKEGADKQLKALRDAKPKNGFASMALNTDEKSVQIDASREHAPLIKRLKAECIRSGLVPSFLNVCLDHSRPNEIKATVSVSTDVPGCKIADAKAELRKFVDAFINDAALAARPVLRWRSSFVVPLRMKEGAAAKLLARFQQEDNWTSEPLSAEAKAYFSYDVSDGAEALPQSFCFSGAKDLKLTITHKDQFDYGPLPRIVTFEKIRVHVFKHDVIALEWVLSADPTKDKDKQSGQTTTRYEWSNLVSSNGGPLDGHAPLNLAYVTDMNASARMIYSTGEFKEASNQEKLLTLALQDGGRDCKTVIGGKGHTPTDPSKPSGWFGALCKAVLGAGENLTIIGDNRARVISSVVLAGDSPSEQSLAPALARLHMVDGWGRGYPYQAEFSANELQKGRYTRFSPGTNYMVSDHSFVMLAFDPCDPDSNGFERKVAPVHMDTIYRHMALMPILYEGVLHSFQIRANKIACMLRCKSKLKETPEQLEALQTDLTEFRNLHMFDRMSSQVQGHDLFRLIENQSTASAELRNLDAEIERIEMSISTRNQFKLADAAARKKHQADVLASGASAIGLSASWYGLMQGLERNATIAEGITAMECALGGLELSIVAPFGLALVIWVLLWLGHVIDRDEGMPRAFRVAYWGPVCALAVVLLVEVGVSRGAEPPEHCQTAADEATQEVQGLPFFPPVIDVEKVPLRLPDPVESFK